VRPLLPLAALLCLVFAYGARAELPCGEVVTVATHAGTTTRYAYNPPKAAQASPVALVLLPGGGGHLDLDAAGCPRALKGNSLVRSAPLFQALGFHTALVDAPSDMPGEDGLAGFRLSAEHANDLGRIVADVRARSGGAAVWLVGTSRGSISAANAAARLAGPAAPEGVVLTSALMFGQSGGRKAYVSQTVFDVPLESIRIPLLVVGHAEDGCVRSPAKLMGGIAERAGSARKQAVTVTGGPGGAGSTGLAACEGKAPHGFIDQEEEVAAGIARFIRGGRY
jgi:hypothetical protein